MKLGDIADIRTGLVLARKKATIGSTVAQRYKVLTLKSFHPEGYVIQSELDVFLAEPHIDDEFITREGDVIIRLSEPNTAVFINASLTGFIIPSLFAIIRLRNDQISPLYLQWLLNSQFVKKQIQRTQIGSTIQIIQTSFLNELHVKPLPLVHQQKISELNQLFLKEKFLLTKLIKEKEILFKVAINSIYEQKTIDGDG